MDNITKIEQGSTLGVTHEANATPQSAEGRNAGRQAGMPFLGSGAEAGIAKLPAPEEFRSKSIGTAIWQNL